MSIGKELIKAIENEYYEIDLDQQILNLWNKYEQSNKQEKKIIDLVFISITGYSFKSFKHQTRE